ncbi:MAG: hypothetical protein HQK65_17700, partial [Desulfamplus sp.]|nr:hypothetical protein [Desulfamplus sp.]
MIDLDSLLNDAGIAFKKLQYPKNGNFDAYLKYQIPCLFDSGHAGTDAYIGQYDNGGIFYKCSHNSCKSKKWKDAIPKLREKGVEFKNYDDESTLPTLGKTSTGSTG